VGGGGRGSLGVVVRGGVALGAGSGKVGWGVSALGLGTGTQGGKKSSRKMKHQVYQGWLRELGVGGRRFVGGVGGGDRTMGGGEGCGGSRGGGLARAPGGLWVAVLVGRISAWEVWRAVGWFGGGVSG